LIIITSAIHLYLISHNEQTSFRQALKRAPGSAAVFIMGLLVIWPDLALLSYHIRLLLLNVTTIEQVRNQAHSSILPGPTPPNPFNLGRWYSNLGYLLCRPAGYSWIEPWEVATEDLREVNPGYTRGSLKGGTVVGGEDNGPVGRLSEADTVSPLGSASLRAGWGKGVPMGMPTDIEPINGANS
jgi:hypothetical protein